MIEGLILIAGIVSLGLFWRFRPPSYESSLLPKDEAIAIATKYIDHIIGVDVTGWKTFSNYWYDYEVVNRMHQLDLLEKWRYLLFDWGIIEAWRIRFIYENNSIVVNINAKREITFLNTNIRDHSLYRELSHMLSTPMEIISILNSPEKGAIWSSVEATGEGERIEDFSKIKNYWYVIEHNKVRMKFNVIVEDNRITQIYNDIDINTDKIQSIVRKEYQESALNLTSFIASLAATIIAIIALIYTTQVTGLFNSLLLVGIMSLAIVLTAVDDIKLSVVNAFDSRLTLKSIYIVSMLSALMGIIAYGFLTFIVSFAGFNLLRINGYQFFDNPLHQLFAGIGIGFICLSISTALFYVFQQKGLLRVSPELSSRSTYLSGFKYRQAVSISAQSSLLEELIYRLLGISLFVWLFHNEFLAVAITSVLWAFLHQGRGFSPPVFRWLQLVLIGVGFGYVFIHYGFLAAFIAHFIHNFMLISLPLFDYKLSKRKQRVYSSINSPIRQGTGD